MEFQIQIWVQMLHLGKWVQGTEGFRVLMCSNMDRGSETNTTFVQTKNRGIFTLKLRNSCFNLFNKGEKLKSNALQVPRVFL